MSDDIFEVKDIDRGFYDFFNEFEYSDKTDKGLNADIVREISEKKASLYGC